MKKLLLLTIIMTAVAICSAQVIHIPADYTTIQEGIDAANNGDVVLVDDGTYYENINFNGKAITVASLFYDDGDTNHINNTIIDGSSEANSVVSLTSGEDTTSILYGLTVTHGEGMWSSTFQSQAGGGIVCINAGVKIVHCRITENEVINDNKAMGGGISCMISNGQFNIVIEHNIIENNEALVTNQIAAGGGIFIGGASPATEIYARISNNTIKDNYCKSDFARADGGGIKTELVAMAQGTFNIFDNLIQSNSIKGNSTRGGGLCGITCGGMITNNIFLNNFIDENSGQFRGAAICYKGATETIEIIGNQIIENDSPIITSDGTGAVSIMDSYENWVNVDRNFFYNNEARVGAGFFARHGYNLTITNNVFWGNSASWGGGLEIYNPETDDHTPPIKAAYTRAGIINNTFVNNSASHQGGAIRIAGTHTIPVIFNTLFWYNTSPDGPDIQNELDEKVLVSYCRINESSISGLWTGSDNISDDPLLNLSDSLCHINGGPCHNFGIGELEVGALTYYAPEVDIDRDLRPQGPAWDIGADECLMVGIPPINDQHTSQLMCYPNPSSGALHLRYQLSDISYLIAEVYAVNGVKVKTLMRGYQQPGDHEQSVDISDLPNGIYFIRLQAGEMVETAKVILMK